VNPFGHRLVETAVNFIVGNGIQIRAKDEKVGAFLNAFWQDPLNLMDSRVFDMARDFSLYGELMPRPKINPYTGDITLSRIDPLQVKELKLDAIDREQIHSVEIGGAATGDIQTLRHVFRDTAGLAPTLMPVYKNASPEVCKGRLVGEFWYWACNKPAGATRGMSDLLPTLDWIQSYEDFLFIALDQLKLKNMAAWRCKITGASEQDLRNFADPEHDRFIEPPEPQSVIFENDSIHWDIVQVNFEGSDLAAAAKLFLIPIAAGSGQPPHFFGTVEDMNRAGVLESNSPVHKMLSARQAFFIQVGVRSILDFALDTKRIFRPETFDGVENFDYQLSAPEIGMRDEVARSTVLLNQVNSIAAAVQIGVYKVDQAMELTLQAFQMGGFDMESAREALAALKAMEPNASEGSQAAVAENLLARILESADPND
jgi:hypothetical protein